MILRSAVLLLNLVVARTAVNVSFEDDSDISDIDVRKSLWPSTFNVHIQGSIQNEGPSSTQKDAQPDKAAIHAMSDRRVTWASLGIGGLVLLAIAYYCIIYRKKGNTNGAINPHSSTDQRFLYGVLKSEDNRRNMELSRVPLITESDEDEEQDLRVLDLGQQKKSQPSILQHDEDIVFNDSKSVDLENLLIEIEDKNLDTMK